MSAADDRLDEGDLEVIVRSLDRIEAHLKGIRSSVWWLAAIALFPIIVGFIAGLVYGFIEFS